MLSLAGRGGRHDTHRVALERRCSLAASAASLASSWRVVSVSFSRSSRMALFCARSQVRRVGVRGAAFRPASKRSMHLALNVLAGHLGCLLALGHCRKAPGVTHGRSVRQGHAPVVCSSTSSASRSAQARSFCCAASPSAAAAMASCTRPPAPRTSAISLVSLACASRAAATSAIDCVPCRSGRAQSAQRTATATHLAQPSLHLLHRRAVHTGPHEKTTRVRVGGCASKRA